MHALRYEEPDLEGILRRGLYPEVIQRAMTFARPVLAEAETASFRNDAGDDAEPVRIDVLVAALAKAIGMAVTDVILLPDHMQFPVVKKMASTGQLSPKRRLGDILNRLYGGVVRVLAEDVRRGLQGHLIRVFRTDDERLAMSDGLAFASRTCRRDLLYHFMALSMMGDDRRAGRLADLVRLSRRVVPLAVVNEQTGFWVARRV